MALREECIPRPNMALRVRVLGPNMVLSGSFLRQFFTCLIVTSMLCLRVEAACSKIPEQGCYPDSQSMLHTRPNLRTLDVSSTCGDPTPTIYQFPELLVDYTCYAGNHSSQYARDINIINIAGNLITLGKTDTYWQSRTLEKSQAQWMIVNMTDSFLFDSITLKFFAPTLPDLIDMRPRAIAFEKCSLYNATDCTPLRYYSENCTSYFPGVPVPKSSEDFGPDILICEERYYSGDTYNPDGITVYYSPFSEVSEVSADVQEEFTMSVLRVNLVASSHDKPLTSYYAVTDIDVKARCSCFGHSSNCSGDNDQVCNCLHNTQGAQCERCKPLYNNQEWQINVPCEDCGCGGYSDSCVYDSVKKHGVCQGCRGNTTGDKCNKCLENFYKRTTPGGPHPYECAPCDCSIQGTASASNFLCDSETGTCQCKANVGGRVCDECKDTFWNLDPNNPNGCQACNCIAAGSFNSINFCNKTTGVCLCKENTQGTRCGQCKLGSYNLTIDNPDGCSRCNCDLGSSLTAQCDGSGVCSCKPGYSGRNCLAVSSRSFVGALDYLTYEAEEVTDVDPKLVVERASGPTHTGRGFVRLDKTTSIKYTDVRVPADHRYDAVFRMEPSDSNATVQATFGRQSNVGHACGQQTVLPNQELSVSNGEPVCLQGNKDYTVEVIVTVPDGSFVLLDSLVLLPTLQDMTSYVSEVTTSATKQLMEKCHSLARGGNWEERRALNCYNGAEFSIVSGLTPRSPSCDCDPTGTVAGSTCDSRGGQCQCKPGVGGLRCDQCLAFHYEFGENGCKACNCNSLGSLLQSCDKTGACSCKKNVDGNKCDSCFPGYKGLHTGEGCSPCDCNGRYAIDSSTCDDYGKCNCKPGVNGIRCEGCQAGFYNLTDAGCESCDCHPDGSSSAVCNDKSGVCQCKNRTTGDKCAQCKPGYFGLGAWDPVQGCLPCYCSGHTTSCSSAPQYYLTFAKSDWSVSADSITDPVWDAMDGEGRLVTFESPTMTTKEDGLVDIRRVVLVSNVDSNQPKTHLFFKAIDSFLGDKQSSYGNQLTFELSSSSNHSLVNRSSGDVVIRGSHVSYALVAQLPSIPEQQPTKYTFTLREGDWYIDSIGGPSATYEQMMKVLYSVEDLLIRAKYSNESGAEVRLYSAKLGYATSVREKSTNQSVTNMELCQCPSGYKGSHCEQCDVGFRRSPPNSDVFSKCIACDCNGHGNPSSPCNATTGVCSCIHNTYGDSCDACRDGFHGNATEGSPGDCQPCACPGNIPRGDVNVFSATCSRNATGFVSCDACAEGHVGSNCERCDVNYYGQPRNVSNNGGRCSKCQCNGFADTCDSLTGVCIACRDNTAGMNCERCAAGYYGNPLNNKPCKACDNCNNPGSTGECDHVTSQCVCRPFVEGFNCSACVANAFNYSSGQGCQLCQCDEKGAVGSSCDQSGQCQCRLNVQGRRCDTCKEGHYNINSQTGCDACACNMTGSDSINCDLVTGQCSCNKPSIGGRMCNQCQKGSSGEYSYVRGVYVGTFPDCELCGNCFDSWAKKIDEVGLKMATEYNKALDIWNNFDNKTVEEFRPILDTMRQNVTAVNDSIALAQTLTGHLGYLREGYDQILQEIDRLDKLLAALDQTFGHLDLSNATAFDGSVDVGQAGTESPASLRTKIEQYTTQQMAVYAAGNASWNNIANMTAGIISANQTMQELIRRVADSLNKLQVAENNRNSATKIATKRSTLEEVDTNRNKVNQLNDAMSGVDESGLQQKISSAESSAGQASTSIQSASRTVNQRKVDMEGKIMESQYVTQNASQARMSANTAKSAAEVYKKLASELMSNLTAVVNDVRTARQNLVTIGNRTNVSEALSSATLAITLRSLSAILNITQQINATNISPDKVNQTYAAARFGEKTAAEVLNITGRAQKEALDALAVFNNIQTNLGQAASDRNSTEYLLAEIVTLENRINAIIKTVKDKAILATSSGTSTNNQLQRFKSEILGIEQSYQLTKALVESGRNTSQKALDSINEAEKTLNQLVSDAKQTSQKTSAEQATASTAQDDLRDASTRLDVLSKYLKEAGDIVTNEPGVGTLSALLDLYRQQRFQISALQAEINSLEGELDSVISTFESADPNSCKP